MNEAWTQVFTPQDITPEKALWCSILLTYVEDMNHFINLKDEILESKKQLFDVGNMGLEASGVMKKHDLINLIHARMRRLIFMAKNSYTRHIMEILGIHHGRLVSALEYQYKNNVAVKLSFTAHNY